MGDIKVTRDFFLWCMSAIYLSAFSSLYHQIPGLYGDNGVLPARAIISLEADADVLHRKTKEVPSFLWFAPVFGIDVPLMMDFLALIGIAISFGCLVWGRMRDLTNFALLWMLYFSLFQVGQTFMWFQWDILLLEAGFLTIFVAPLGFLQRSVARQFLSSLPHRPHDNITLWLIRWLLFRLMFASGVVKLTSMCPTWWNLTALNYHFESQCIPTPLAWFAHHIPIWILKLGVISTFVIEIAVPFLFFSPLRSLRIFSFYTQVLFQVMIMLTGNYNFFNLLTITLCVSLLDDEFLLNFIGRPVQSSKCNNNTGLCWINYITAKAIEIVVYGGLIYWTIHFFNLNLLSDWVVSSKTAFTPSQFERALVAALPISVCIGALSLAGNIFLAFNKSINQSGIACVKSMLATTFITGCAVWLFLLSLVPHAAVDLKTQNALWPIIRKWHKNVDHFKVANSYGLFRRMTGVDGRPEIVIEGSNLINTGWKEYHFLHKPGDVSQRPQFLIPHQPRLDWQMWFAALGDYQYNPWFMSLIYRLLDGQKEVLNLLDVERLPFPANQPPKFIRAILYKYSYTPFQNSKRVNDWWTRKKVKEYFNSAYLEGSQMVDFLNAAGISMERTRFIRVTNLFLKRSLTKIRKYVESMQATTFIWSLLSTGLFLNLLSPILRL